MKKVIDDLKQFGTVQRAYLGVQLMRQQDKTAINNKRNSGVYVADAPINGGAYQAGIRKNDYITRVNDVTVNSEPELLEQVARFKPGDNVSVTYNRDGKEYNTTVLLKNVNGTTAVLKGQTASISEVLGAAMRPLSLEEKNRYGAENGVLVTKIARGVLSQQTTMKNGFVILKANDQEVNSADDIQQVIAENGSVKLGGFYPGNNGMYYYGIRVDPSLFAE